MPLPLTHSQGGLGWAGLELSLEFGREEETEENHQDQMVATDVQAGSWGHG